MHFPAIKKVYLIGMEGLEVELEKAGIQCVTSCISTESKIFDMSSFTSLKVDQSIEAVVMGIDTNLDYQKLCYASVLIQQGKPFVATNTDAFDCLPEGVFAGNGSAVAGLTVAVNKEPSIVGKPFTTQVEVFMADHGLKEEDKRRMVVIGDRLDTDVLLGKNAGVDSALILTGCTSKKELEAEKKKKSGIVPTFVLESLKI